MVCGQQPPFGQVSLWLNQIEANRLQMHLRRRRCNRFAAAVEYIPTLDRYCIHLFGYVREFRENRTGLALHSYFVTRIFLFYITVYTTGVVIWQKCVRSSSLNLFLLNTRSVYSFREQIECKTQVYNKHLSVRWRTALNNSPLGAHRHRQAAVNTPLALFCFDNKDT